MLAITTISERTGHWTRTRPPFALFSGSEPSRHTRSSVDFITITPGFRFSVHTGGRVFCCSRGGLSCCTSDGPFASSAWTAYVAPRRAIAANSAKPFKGASSQIGANLRAGRAIGTSRQWRELQQALSKERERWGITWIDYH